MILLGKNPGITSNTHDDNIEECLIVKLFKEIDSNETSTASDCDSIKKNKIQMKCH